MSPFDLTGRVASLHLHPAKGGNDMLPVEELVLEEGKGIVGNGRYYNRQTHGQPSKRQVSLIEREQLAEHANTLGIDRIAPGQARSNIETEGIDLVRFVGKRLQIGEARIYVTVARDPCSKMDLICEGLRKLMDNSKQGVLAQVVKSGRVKPGDSISLCPD